MQLISVSDADGEVCTASAGMLCHVTLSLSHAIHRDSYIEPTGNQRTTQPSHDAGAAAGL